MVHEPARRPSPFNFSWVVAGCLAGSARPSTDEQFAFLSECGVSTLVSLTEQSLAPELLASHGLRAFHSPVPDYTAPSPAQATGLVTLIRDLLDEGKVVLVHCGAGYGRTGTILACYLVAEGMSAADAISEVRRNRPGSIETKAQEELVSGFERSIRC